MNYKKVIADSWQFTQQNKSLIFWFGFIPSLFTTTVGVFYIAYQFFAFKSSYLFDNDEHGIFYYVMDYLWSFTQDHVSLMIGVLVLGLFLTIIYFILPPIATGSAIQSIARARNGQPHGVGVGLKYGILSFLKLFEYKLLVQIFAFFSILFEMSFVIRNLGMDIFLFLFPVFIILLIVSIILTLLFTFSEFFIVIDDEGVFESMKKSGVLVIQNWTHTFFITLLMIVIGVRIVIQAVLIFLIPGMVILVSSYLTGIALPTVGLVVSTILAAVGIIFAAYISGVVEIFAYTVWTYTFLDLSDEANVSAREKVAGAEESAGEIDHHHKEQVDGGENEHTS